MDKWKVSTLVLAGFVGGMVYTSAGGIDANAGYTPRPECAYADPRLSVGAETELVKWIAVQRAGGRQTTTVIPSGLHDGIVLVCSW